MINNNATTIIKSWIEKYHRTGWVGFAQWVENATGVYPDDPFFQSESEPTKANELDFINVPNMIY